MRVAANRNWLSCIAVLAVVMTGCDGVNPGDADAGPEASVLDADADVHMPDVHDAMVVADARPDTGWCGENPFPGVDPNALELTPSVPTGMSPHFSRDGSHIVYARDASEPSEPVINYEVYMFDIDAWQETRLTYLPDSHQGNPSIHGDLVIWSDGRYRTTGVDDYRYELIQYNTTSSQETRLTDSPNGKAAPRYNGRYVAYSFIAEGASVDELRLLDLDTNDDILLSPASQAPEGESISDRYVTWVAMPPDAQNYNKDVHIHDIQTQQTVRLDSTAGNATLSTSVWGSKVVWMDFRHGQWDIYLYDIEVDQEIRLTDDPFDQVAPRIFENLVTFNDYRFTVGYYDGYCARDIFILDIDTMIERRVTSLPWSWFGVPGADGWLLAMLRDEPSLSADAKLYLFDLVSMDILDPTGQHVLPGP